MPEHGPDPDLSTTGLQRALAMFAVWLDPALTKPEALTKANAYLDHLVARAKDERGG